MKKKVISTSFLLYIFLNVLLIVLPFKTSQGYEDISWRLFVGQVYTIPITLIFIVILTVIYKIKKDKK